MKRYPFPETKGTKALTCLGVLALLCLSRSTMFALSILGFYETQFAMLGIMALTVLAFLVRNRRSWKEVLTDGRVGVALLAGAALLLPMLFKRDWQFMYLTVAVSVWFAVFLTYFLDVEQLGRAYVWVLTFLGAYSILAAYVLRPLADMGLLNVPTFRNPDQFEFYNFGLSVVGIIYIPYRNFGIFREPGVYQFFLLLALYLDFYKLTWDEPWKQWLLGGILSLTLATTFTTGGVACLGLFLLVLFLDRKLYKNKRVLAVVLAAAAVLAVAIVYSISVQNTLYEALNEMVVAKFAGRTDSYVERTEAFSVDAALFLQSPIWGERFSDVLHAVTHNTTSTLVQFAVYGLIGGWFHLAAWFIFLWDKARKAWVNIALTAIFLIAFNTQNLTADLFFWLLPVMDLTERLAPKLELRRKERHG